jgi:hypothetical protein
MRTNINEVKSEFSQTKMHVGKLDASYKTQAEEEDEEE